MISTINWTIIGARGGFEVRERDVIIATITTDGKRWRVHFTDTEQALDFEWDNLDVCVGYVRGIERVNVNLAYGVRFKKVTKEEPRRNLRKRA